MLKGSLGSFSANLGGDRQQLNIILSLKWRNYRKNFQGPVPCFFLPDICSQTILLAVWLAWALQGDMSFAETRCCWAASEAAQVCMRHWSFWLNSMSPWLSWHPICFPSLVAIRTVSNMRGQNLIRVWKSWKIYWLPLQLAIFLLVAFLGGRKNWVCEVFLNLLSPEIQKRTVRSCTPQTEAPEQLHPQSHSSTCVAQLGTLGLWHRLPKKDVSALKPPWLNHCVVFPSKCSRVRKGKSSLWSYVELSFVQKQE